MLLWEAFLPEDAPPAWVSLPEYVHREKDGLRSRYQSWLSGISQRELHGVSVAEFMSIRSNLSYWWMTLPTDNSLAADSPAYRVLRLFALASVAEGMKFDHVKVVADRRAVAEAVALWADSTGKPCQVDFNEPSMGQSSRHQRSRRPILAAIRVFWNHLLISMQPSRKASRAATREGIVFIDYLAHLRKPELEGAFRSNYWGPLVELLEDWPEPVNWLHIPATYATPTVIRSDVAKCEAFNATHPAHSLLHSYLDLKTVLRASRDYVRIRRLGKKFWKQRDLLVETGTRLDPSPLLHELIQDQYFGRTAALNAFWISLWESTIHALPRQRLGVYLFENQPWELAFLSAWQRSHFGRALAFAHSTMRFWDLRYFSHDNSTSLCGRPAPSSVVVNGPLMRATALSGGYSKSLLSVAETLRSQTDLPLQVEVFADLLVLGEYEIAHNERVVKFATELAHNMGSAISVMYRSHPAAESSPIAIPVNWLVSEHESINDAVARCSVAICGPTTSAALDARLMGKRVIVLGRGDTLISNPAIGLQGVDLVTTESQLDSQTSRALLEPVMDLPESPLCRDVHLSGWRDILVDRDSDSKNSQLA